MESEEENDTDALGPTPSTSTTTFSSSTSLFVSPLPSPSPSLLTSTSTSSLLNSPFPTTYTSSFIVGLPLSTAYHVLPINISPTLLSTGSTSTTILGTTEPGTTTATTSKEQTSSYTSTSLSLSPSPSPFTSPSLSWLPSESPSLPLLPSESPSFSESPSYSAISSSPFASLPITPSPSASFTPSLGPMEADYWTAWSLFILLSLLAITLGLSYLFRKWSIRSLHETTVSCILGIVVGLIIHLSGAHHIQAMMVFDPSLFFNLLLPPIIVNSGYEMQRGRFFNLFGSILCYAIFGTLITAFSFGIFVYVFCLLGIDGVRLSFLEASLFGAIISATDPVTVLAIFSQLKVDPKLYNLIFGESLLNDAIAIVLYQALRSMQASPGSGSTDMVDLVGFTGVFLGVFFGSLLIGVVAGLLMALLFKHSYLCLYPNLESSLFLLLSLMTYLLSNGLQMSGIVSLLFCGVINKHYTSVNLSKRSRHTVKHMFRVMSTLSENFIFIYLGATLFTYSGEVFKVFLIFVSLIGIMVSRAANVFPISWLINAVNQPQHRVSWNHQLMLWWSGLRGAIAFALSLDVSTPNAPAIRTATLIIVILSVLFLGGSTMSALSYLKIETGVQNDEDGSDSDDDNDNHVSYLRTVRNNSVYSIVAAQDEDEENDENLNPNDGGTMTGKPRSKVHRHRPIRTSRTIQRAKDQYEEDADDADGDNASMEIDEVDDDDDNDDDGGIDNDDESDGWNEDARTVARKGRRKSLNKNRNKSDRKTRDSDSTFSKVTSVFGKQHNWHRNIGINGNADGEETSVAIPLVPLSRKSSSNSVSGSRSSRSSRDSHGSGDRLVLAVENSRSLNVRASDDHDTININGMQSSHSNSSIASQNRRSSPVFKNKQLWTWRKQPSQEALFSPQESNWFNRLDQSYLKNFFTNSSSPREGKYTNIDLGLENSDKQIQQQQLKSSGDGQRSHDRGKTQLQSIRDRDRHSQTSRPHSVDAQRKRQSMSSGSPSITSAAKPDSSSLRNSKPHSSPPPHKLLLDESPQSRSYASPYNGSETEYNVDQIQEVEMNITNMDQPHYNENPYGDHNWRREERRSIPVPPSSTKSLSGISSRKMTRLSGQLPVSTSSSSSSLSNSSSRSNSASRMVIVKSDLRPSSSFGSSSNVKEDANAISAPVHSQDVFVSVSDTFTNNSHGNLDDEDGWNVEFGGFSNFVDSTNAPDDQDNAFK